MFSNLLLMPFLSALALAALDISSLQTFSRPSRRDQERAKSWHRRLLVQRNRMTRIGGLMMVWIAVNLAAVVSFYGNAIWWVAGFLGLAGLALNVAALCWRQLYQNR